MKQTTLSFIAHLSHWLLPANQSFQRYVLFLLPGFYLVPWTSCTSGLIALQLLRDIVGWNSEHHLGTTQQTMEDNSTKDKGVSIGWWTLSSWIERSGVDMEYAKHFKAFKKTKIKSAKAWSGRYWDRIKTDLDSKDRTAATLLFATIVWIIF